MLFFQSVGLLFAFQLLGTGTGSMVQLKNNGYEDLVIAIHPGIPENNKVIQNIQDMVTEASTYLFQATHRRAYFKSVKILIPLTWTKHATYLRAKTESFDKADVIVADPFLKYGNDPYTLQYGGCGEPAKYIHFTPNFILDDTLLQVYGPRGRVFVHEWAHLRWGVFDEYNSDRPFYVSGNVNVEATRCSKDVQGKNQVIECRGSSCSARDCKYDALTGLFEERCTFIPEKNQQTQASVMYMQALSTVVQFCNSSTHNTEAPNLQNRMCNFESTWDVILRSQDFIGTSPMSGTVSPPPPAFSLLQSSDRVVCIVLDTSGSMAASDRINRQFQAAELFLLQIIEAGSFVGIVTFESNAYIKATLRQLFNDKQRKDLVAFLPNRASGGTNICAGIRKGLEVNRQSGNSYGTEIVLLTDGEDNFDTKLCFPDVMSSGAIIHVIALGPSASKELEKIADMSGGLKFAATDNLDSNGLIDAFSGISSGSGDISQQSIQLESDALQLANSRCLDKIVSIDSTVGNDTFFVVTWQRGIPNIKVVAPNGAAYFNAAFMVDSATRTARLQIPGTAQAGDWMYSVCNTQTTEQVLSMTVTTRAANNNVPPVTVKAHMNKDTTSFPNPMVVYAEVSQGFLPVLGANVTAIIEPEAGKTVTIELSDNGAGADIAKNDGIYSRYFTSFSGNGRYSLKVRVQGKDTTTRRGRRMPRSQALYIPGYIDKGVYSLNPPRPAVPDEDIQAKLESFSRTASGGSFVVSAVPTGTLPDIFPPSKITDLEARIVEKQIDLSWTAPGGDLDQGQAASYDVRMSTNPLDLRDHFETAASVDVSALKPQPAGSTETFSFIPQNLALANGTILYFALRARDGLNNTADVSNTAQAAMFVPPPVPPSTDSPTTAGHTTSTTSSTTSAPPPISPDSTAQDVILIVIIVCSAAVLISLIISITLCILSCNRKGRRHETGM
ncbi:calcium-activated chloride channel regulator 1-like [Ambystoma mexicanum]|uniref:calcium-activated chloride channel regulator 1-like n=1 Tax=Ambystoma mexicanum TaxID=8296 RepID=UPI0037E82926